MKGSFSPYHILTKLLLFSQVLRLRLNLENLKKGWKMAYKHTNKKGVDYYLHSKEVKLRSGRNQTIYYFAKEAGSGSLDNVPAGFKVVENERTGLPILKKS
ncbi:MAG: hypothetical protein UU73_C0001G0296 [Candidatus Daviesbacteria bacterium GW2011_GWA1_41_61]|uniref:Uncharacterized protein n=1 Tax=Candidatus Daviesbacteria bacterium GW2011_GWA2_40_9 TaxID=1618424 RepID=A0A0G0U8G0_9BACT|nr:MAG: hypothetical protein UU26_C0029G0006 [Candidatus Daviesbacteria bacterium GW2011_GWC1_40_9]KKR83546.1 MAG: hypothetical protein UU29_C0004G0047 [Candidatus Daviesbacteria bacterium GW2011_GWA2_40_9]KKR93115.1 MAG: hypothetical protein UU44_C0004G0297 [Candidatus Daviesbacteria bacterium GW2011_GWB1_41_15]KKS15659.1 MAG: hypothetical protein UU73_C0001G0296 [Candidatus Daviesbacteria bacterium GW2011_GWA1_41_61]